ncbi:MAG: DUF2118 domain-containing protein [Sulfolobales archaeon]
MSLKPGEASAKVLKDLDEVLRYYRPAECYIENTKIECHELALELIRKRSVEADLTVCNRRRDICLSLARGSKVAIVEISGSEVYPQVDIGDYVRVNELLAYIITGKGEVRSKRSALEGYVALLYEDPASRPLKCYIILTTEGGVVSGSQES